MDAPRGKTPQVIGKGRGGNVSVHSPYRKSGGAWKLASRFYVL